MPRSNNSSQGITDGAVGDAQAAAFAMAVYFQGMDIEERVALTRAMSQSGTTMHVGSRRPARPVVDKHSTGGVGDKVSLMLAPLVAACGAHVPMISGRGLGHTGGTFDKLESIPGYQTPARQRRCSTRSSPRSVARSSARLRPRAGRRPAVRNSRRHGDGRIDPADHRIDPVEEAGRRARRVGDERHVRQRRVHERSRPAPRSSHTASSMSPSVPGCGPMRCSPT